MGLVDVVHVVEAHGLLVHGRHTAQGTRGNGGAVVGILAADDQFLVGLAQQIEVAMHQFQLGVVGLGTRIGEKGVVESGRGDLAQLAGQFHRGLVRAFEEVVVKGQFVELGGDGVLDGVHAVAQVAAPQTGHAVLDLVAIGVVNVDVLGPADNAAAVLGIVMEIRKRVEMVVLIELLECVGIQCCVHGISPSLAVLSGLLSIVAFSPAESQFNGRYRGTSG